MGLGDNDAVDNVVVAADPVVGLGAQRRKYRPSRLLMNTASLRPSVVTSYEAKGPTLPYTVVALKELLGTVHNQFWCCLDLSDYH